MFFGNSIVDSNRARTHALGRPAKGIAMFQSIRNFFRTNGIMLGRRVLVLRRSRAARFHWEHYRDARTAYIKIGIAHPRQHAWWAFTLWFYYRLGK